MSEFSLVFTIYYVYIISYPNQFPTKLNLHVVVNMAEVDVVTSHPNVDEGYIFMIGQAYVVIKTLWYNNLVMLKPLQSFNMYM